MSSTYTQQRETPHETTGRVLVENDDEEKGKSFTSRLVKIERPILRIPTLAIHLDDDMRKGFKFNYETQTVPIFATG